MHKGFVEALANKPHLLELLIQVNAVSKTRQHCSLSCPVNVLLKDQKGCADHLTVRHYCAGQWTSHSLIKMLHVYIGGTT